MKPIAQIFLPVVSTLGVSALPLSRLLPNVAVLNIILDFIINHLGTQSEYLGEGL